MMAAICGAHARKNTIIHGAECVQKSYPSFFEDFRALGGVAHESEV
jgi:3-phosphoshikimate 1-carboxyvinyltransferase